MLLGIFNEFIYLLYIAILLLQLFSYRPSRPMSPIPTFDDEEIALNSVDSNLSTINVIKENISDLAHENINDNSNRNSLCINDNKTLETMEGKCIDAFGNMTIQKNNNENLNGKIIDVESTQECTESYEENNSKYSPKANDNVHRVHSVNTITLGMGDADNSLPRDTSNDALSDARLTNNITQIAHINPEHCGLPLSLFTKVYIRFLFKNQLKSIYVFFITYNQIYVLFSRDIFVYHIYLYHI